MNIVVNTLNLNYFEVNFMFYLSIFANGQGLQMRLRYFRELR